ncbi:hypothetical protein C4577_05995 [Candidatus Parcubacteria bacterium]|nr:MAG: hypothetical protein C4577_05995 [Candidatus Parcubacteria bacterium]
MQESNFETIGKRSARGIAALISRSFFLNIISYATSLVIFTYLTPKEFGIYAVVIAMQRVVSFVTDFGLGAALVQKKNELKKEDTTTFFTIQVVITLLALIILFFARDLISSYFKLSETSIWLLLVLVFTVFLSSFKVIPSVQLERKIRFDKLIIPQIIESFVFNMLLIVLLVANQGLKSYIWGFLVSSLVSIPAYYYISPWKIRIGIYRESLKHLKYGIQFQGKNILATIKDDFLTIFLAKILTFQEIGYIGFGQRNAFFAYRSVVDNVTKVTFSTYSRIQDNLEALRVAINKSFFYVSLLMFPILSGVIIFAPYLVEYFPRWQGKWELGLVSLTFFSLNALISSISGILITLLDSSGKVKTTLKLMTLWTILTWTLTPLFIYIFGFNGVAIASFLITFTIVITIRLAKKVVEFDLLQNIYKPLISTVVMSVFAYWCAQLLVSNMISLIVVVFISGLIYVINIYLLAKEELFQGVKLIFIKST